jgi:hypothetical protein
MKKQILFLTLSLLSAINGMDLSVKKLKLLDFPADENFNEGLFQFLPIELEHRIVQYLLALNNIPSFSTSQDQFFRKLLGCCVSRWDQTKEWKISAHFLEISDDGHYYLGVGYASGWKDWRAFLYNAKTQELIKSFLVHYPHEGKDVVFLRKRNILMSKKILEDEREQFVLYDIATDTLLRINPNPSYMINSLSERLLAGIGDNCIYVWDIADLSNITCKKYEGNFKSKDSRVQFLSDEKYLLYEKSCEGVALLAIDDAGLKELERHSYDFPFDYVEAQRDSDAEYFKINSRLMQGDLRSVGLKIDKNSDDQIV